MLKIVSISVNLDFNSEEIAESISCSLKNAASIIFARFLASRSFSFSSESLLSFLFSFSLFVSSSLIFPLMETIFTFTFGFSPRDSIALLYKDVFLLAEYKSPNVKTPEWHFTWIHSSRTSST